MIKSIKTRKYALSVFILLVFAAMLVFFTCLHPVPVMDGDDMLYTIYTRPAVPSPTTWNPSRVLPELLMPTAGNLAGVLAALGFGSFIDCQVFTLALTLSLFICLYIYEIASFLREKCGNSAYRAIMLSTVFLLLHFLIFRVGLSRNSYMFRAYDACCVYFYTIPALLNCSLFVFLLRRPEAWRELPARPIRGSAMVLAVYFAIFSNLYASILPAAYSGYRILCALIEALRRREKLLEPLKRELFSIIIVALWLVALSFDGLGGRANSLMGDMSFTESIKAVLECLAALLSGFNKIFVLLLAVSLLGAAVVAILRRGKPGNREFLTYTAAVTACGMISLLFIVLLCAVACVPNYIYRPEVSFVPLFAVMLLMILFIEYIIRAYKLPDAFLPLLIIVIYSFTNTKELTFIDSNALGINGHLAVEIQNDICEQIISAAESGEEEMTLYLIDTPDDWSNWPCDTSTGDSLKGFFLKFGLIDRDIRINPVPSFEYNEKYGVCLPTQP